MAKPTAKSTVGQMKEYIRLKKLNKAPILLGMKRAELIAGLRKLGHWDAQHDKPSAKVPAPKAVPKPAPKRKVLKKAQEVGGEGSGVMPNPPLPKKKAPAPKKKAPEPKKKAALFPATLSFRKESFKDLAEVEAMLEKEERPEAIKELKALRRKGRTLETQYKRGWLQRPGGSLPGDAGYKKARGPAVKEPTDKSIDFQKIKEILKSSEFDFRKTMTKVDKGRRLLVGSHGDDNVNELITKIDKLFKSNPLVYNNVIFQTNSYAPNPKTGEQDGVYRKPKKIFMGKLL